MSWIENLPEPVRRRLAMCANEKEDLPIMVNTKWADMKCKGKGKKGFTKEDALIFILELVGDWNGQHKITDITEDEYNELKKD